MYCLFIYLFIVLFLKVLLVVYSSRNKLLLQIILYYPSGLQGARIRKIHYSIITIHINRTVF